jgi:hypothetical protein
MECETSVTAQTTKVLPSAKIAVALVTNHEQKQGKKRKVGVTAKTHPKTKSKAKPSPATKVGGKRNSNPKKNSKEKPLPDGNRDLAEDGAQRTTSDKGA